MAEPRINFFYPLTHSGLAEKNWSQVPDTINNNNNNDTTYKVP